MVGGPRWVVVPAPLVAGGPGLQSRPMGRCCERGERSPRPQLQNASAMHTLARSSARLGRDDGALHALFPTASLRAMLEAEDYTLMGLALQRQTAAHGRPRAWLRAINADPVATSLRSRNSPGSFIQYPPARRGDPPPSGWALVPGWEGRGQMMLGTVRAGLRRCAGRGRIFPPAPSDQAEGVRELRRPDRPPASWSHHLPSGGPARRGPPAVAGDPGPQARRWNPGGWWVRTTSRRAISRPGASRRSQTPAPSGRGTPSRGRAGPLCRRGPFHLLPCEQIVQELSRESAHPKLLPRRSASPACPGRTSPLARPRQSRRHARPPAARRLVCERRRASWIFRSCESVIEYAFGTDDRYLTTVGRDARGELPNREVVVFPDGGGPGVRGTVVPRQGPPQPRLRTSRAKSSACTTAWPSACIATPPIREPAAHRPGRGIGPGHRLRALP